MRGELPGRVGIWIVTACVVGSGLSIALIGSRSAASPPDKIIPFASFVHSVEVATVTGYAGRPGYRVVDGAAFDQMKTYLLAQYERASVQDSYLDMGATFDCVPYDRQPGSMGPIIQAAAPKEFRWDPRCPPGDISWRRLTLDELVKYPTLDKYLNSAPVQLP